MNLKFSGFLKTVSTIVVLRVATPCSLPSVLQLLEETRCLFSKVFVDLRATRSYNLRFRYMNSRIYLYGVKINTNTKINCFVFILKTVSKTQRDVSSTNFVYSTGSL